METSLIDSIVQIIANIINIDNLKAFAPIVALAALISAFTSSKAEHKNPVIKLVLQTVKDVINILAINVAKAKNADDNG